LAREIKLPNPADQEFLEVSASYGRIKIAIMAQIWTMQILAARENLGADLDKAAMRQAIERYDQLWCEWRQLKPEHACCPTLYKDDVAMPGGGTLFKTVLSLYREKSGNITHKISQDPMNRKKRFANL
ncbi:MAG: hypothetical protein WCJ07_15220, partial [Verrucomicrobiota bacterium]